MRKTNIFYDENSIHLNDKFTNELMRNNSETTLCILLLFDFYQILNTLQLIH